MNQDMLKQIWPEWEIESQLGKGSFGVVYKAVRRDHGVESYAAIKVISIPSDSSEIDSLRSEGLDMNATRTYLNGVVTDFVSEIQLMESLKGVQNIVSVEDYKVIEKTGEIGWDIYIRMELLTPFTNYIRNNTLSENDVIKIGCDICNALIICEKQNIIHRDIKPENIFVNNFGDFKLGDFGIARKMENVTGGMSQKGTYNYMAPEVARSSEYDARVDTYSLGVVLYRLMNANKLPFIENENQLMNPNERKLAVDKRMRGDALPAPCNASPAMANVILRACAYDPDQRFKSAEEMKKALTAVAAGTYEPVVINTAVSDPDKTVSVRGTKTNNGFVKNEGIASFDGKTKKKSKLPLVIAAVLLVVVIAVIGAFAVPAIMKDKGDDPWDNAADGASTDNNEKDVNDNDAVASVLEDAENLASDGNYEEALSKVQEGLAENPNSNELKAKEEEYTAAIADKNRKAAIDSAEKLASSGDYEGAMNAIKNAENAYGSSDELKTAYDKYDKANKEKIKADALDEAASLAVMGDYLGAAGILDDAITKIGNDAELKAMQTTYKNADYRVSILAEAAKYAENKDYATAISTLNGAKSILGDDAEINKQINAYSTEYENDCIVKATQYIAEKKYSEAEEVLTKASEVIPGSEKIKSKLDEIDKLKPVPLSELVVVDSQTYEYKKGLFVDTFGYEYNDCYRIGTDWSTSNPVGYAVYNLNKEFASFTATVVAPDELGSDSVMECRFYVDDLLVYRVENFKRTTLKKEFTIDVSGGSTLKIEVYRNNSNRDVVICLVNATLTK